MTDMHVLLDIEISNRHATKRKQLLRQLEEMRIEFRNDSSLKAEFAIRKRLGLTDA